MSPSQFDRFAGASGRAEGHHQRGQKLPSARVTSASSVGLPRLSRISRAWTVENFGHHFAGSGIVGSRRALSARYWRPKESRSKAFESRLRAASVAKGHRQSSTEYAWQPFFSRSPGVPWLSSHAEQSLLWRLQIAASAEVRDPPAIASLWRAISKSRRFHLDIPFNASASRKRSTDGLRIARAP